MKIKNCPFCGGEAVTYSSDIDMYGNLMYGAMCKHTGCGVISCVYPSKEQAIEAWNRRKPLEDIVEQLEEASYWTEPTYDEDGYSHDDEIEVIDLSDAIEIVKGGAV